MLDKNGDTIAVVKKLWAIDANGTALPTSFTIKDHIITQHVDTREAVFPVISDPDFWVKATCIAAVASLLGGGWLKAADIVVKIGKVVKHSKGFRDAYRAVTGTSKVSLKEIKYVMGMYKKYFDGKLSTTDHRKVATLLQQGGRSVLEILGVGACWIWYQESKK